MAVMSLHRRTLGAHSGFGAVVLRAAILSIAVALPAAAQKALSPGLAASAPKARTSSSAATAGTVSVDYLKGKLPVAPDAVGTLGAQLFGDNVNLYNGAISFEQTDVSLPGNSALPVAVVRSYSPRPWWEGVRGALGDWDLNVPRIEGTFTRDHGFVPAYGGPESRCSGFNMPPDVSVGGQSFANFEYWQGTHLIVPGHGSQEVLRRNAAFTQAAVFPLVTRNLWGISCTPNVLNGAGEGFVATSPAGVQYIFNWIAKRNQASLRKGDGVLTRQDWMLMATKVIDRFGKFVEYTYDPANPLLLTRVSSSDGRAIDLRYVDGRLDSVFDGTRTWLYRYGSQGDLQNVVLPDGSRWTFDLRPMVYVDSPGNDLEVDCDTIPTPPAGIYKGTMWHPSGARGEFETAFASQARTDVPRVCTYILGTTWTNGSIYPRVTNNQALLRKTISGPGLPTLSWRYDVSNGLWPDWGPCASCPDRKVTVVTHPDTSKTRHHFGIRWRINEGQLLQTDEGWDGTQFLRTTRFGYRSAAGQAYPSHFGQSINVLSDQVSYQNWPMESKAINQQGTLFEWHAASAAAGFDSLARPLTTTKRSSLGFTRTDTTSYQDDWSNWILGSISAITEHSTGLTVEAITYDTRMLPKERKSFGLTTESYLYYDDGNPYEIRNAGGRSVWLGVHVRGQPSYATFADGAHEKQSINNLGMPDRRENAAGTVHSFGYDAMGRISQIVYPTGDWSAYNPTNVRFEQTGAPEFGLAPGHWRQSIWTGSGFTIRYFDGFWRERLRWSFDATPERKASTSSYVETRYDHEGRKTFVSYPQRTFDAVDDSPVRVPGVRTTYDSLGRVLVEERDSELGPLRTETRYLPIAFQKEVKNPRGHVTTFAFQAFDIPTEDAIREIWAPEGVNVKINRDVFGKATYISRGGPDGSGTLTATRWYVYEPDHQRLCKVIEPESGATVQDYDASGNVAWKASGLQLPDTSKCDRDRVSSDRKITFGYDLRERLLTTEFGDNSQKITRTYTPDSLLQSIETTGGGRNPIKWKYNHNNRRLLFKETYTWGDPNNNWEFQWGIDGNGHVGGLSDPWGWIGYLPNALGQPTAIGNYASGITFAPNGALSGYKLGNNVTFSATQNVRGMPLEWRHGHLVQDNYAYDKNGNVQQIEDLQGRLHRSMPVYDGLDRLVQSHGPWGTALFTYDALDNITASQVGGRSLTHRYDRASNRLTALLGSVNVAMGYDPNGNVNHRGGVYHHFDIGNRLLHVDGKAGYAYDGHGRRNLMWFADGTYAHQAYTHDGKLRFGWKLGPSGKRHVWLGDTLIAEHDQTGAITYVHVDALGSPVVRSDANGSEITSTRSRYEPYGAVMADTSNAAGIGFTGHVNDPDTGLVYMQQRYYDPMAGRFLSIDPVATDVGNGGLFGRYHYANNNPLRFTDPTGMEPEITCATTGTAVCSSTGSLSGTTSGITSRVSRIADDAITGGYGLRFSSAMENGNYGEAFFHLIAGTTYGVINIASLGNAGILAPVVGRGIQAGGFSLISWTKYPSWAPRPEGTLRILSGAEYDTARSAANAANAALRRADPGAYAGKQIHEILPVKFGGSPTDPANKIALTPGQHAELTNFWNRLLKEVK